jgi:hypothetical protein
MREYPTSLDHTQPEITTGSTGNTGKGEGKGYVRFYLPVFPVPPVVFFRGFLKRVFFNFDNDHGARLE